MNDAVKEQINPDIEITSLYIRYGANIYVFTYEKDGIKKHTFIDTGYAKYKEDINKILATHGINIKNIEHIILTHRHSDHCGLAPYYAAESNATVIVHSGFKPFVEGAISSEEKLWLRGFEPSLLKDCNMAYQDPAESTSAVIISGLEWPVLGKPISLGNSGQLEILGCPESTPSHTPDQIVIRFTPGSAASDDSHTVLPADMILFSGDLWLMHGPITEKSLSHVKHGLAHGLHVIRNIRSFRDRGMRDPRLQDAHAKDSLKHGFVLVRVKPGHGREFLGTRLIPKALLADRDLLIKLGYSMDDSKSLLQNKENLEKLHAIHEEAYANFISEMTLWMESGYNQNDIAQFLTRIFLEQHGGGHLAAQDRVERRLRMREILGRLKSDTVVSQDLREIAGITLPEIDKIK